MSRQRLCERFERLYPEENITAIIGDDFNFEGQVVWRDSQNPGPWEWEATSSGVPGTDPDGGLVTTVFDSFNRTVASGWGTSTFGSAWGSNFDEKLSVNGSNGLLSATPGVTNHSQAYITAPVDNSTPWGLATSFTMYCRWKISSVILYTDPTTTYASLDFLLTRISPQIYGPKIGLQIRNDLDDSDWNGIDLRGGSNYDHEFQVKKNDWVADAYYILKWEVTPTECHFKLWIDECLWDPSKEETEPADWMGSVSNVGTPDLTNTFATDFIVDLWYQYPLNTTKYIYVDYITFETTSNPVLPSSNAYAGIDIDGAYVRGTQNVRVGSPPGGLFQRTHPFTLYVKWKTSVLSHTGFPGAYPVLSFDFVGEDLTIDVDVDEGLPRDITSYVYIQLFGSEWTDTSTYNRIQLNGHNGSIKPSAPFPWGDYEWTEDQWYWLAIEVHPGNSMNLRIWKDGDPEPGTAYLSSDTGAGEFQETANNIVDNFNRTKASSWDGGPWTTVTERVSSSGTGGSWGIDGTRGYTVAPIYVGTGLAWRRITGRLANPGSGPFDVTFESQLSWVAEGGGDGNNVGGSTSLAFGYEGPGEQWIDASIHIFPGYTLPNKDCDLTVYTRAYDQDGNTIYQLSDKYTWVGTDAAFFSSPFKVRVSLEGNTIKAKAWPVGGTEPDWQASQTSPDNLISQYLTTPQYIDYEVTAYEGRTAYVDNFELNGSSNIQTWDTIPIPRVIDQIEMLFGLGNGATSTDKIHIGFIGIEEEGCDCEYGNADGGAVDPTNPCNIIDTFTRTTVGGWGTTDSGHLWLDIPQSGELNDWSEELPSGELNVNGTRGTIAYYLNYAGSGDPVEMIRIPEGMDYPIEVYYEVQGLGPANSSDDYVNQQLYLAPYFHWDINSWIVFSNYYDSYDDGIWIYTSSRDEGGYDWPWGSDTVTLIPISAADATAVWCHRVQVDALGGRTKMWIKNTTEPDWQAEFAWSGTPPPRSYFRYAAFEEQAFITPGSSPQPVLAYDNVSISWTC